MAKGIYLKPKEYYLWRGKISKTYPWQREYLNTEFLEYERKKIEEVSVWYKKLKKSSHGWDGKKERISLYTIPIKLSSSWKVAIDRSGDYKVIALSALYNTPINTVLALIPKDVKRPREYRLIDIMDSEREYIINRQTNVIEIALVIKEWAYIHSDYIYKYDAKYERNAVEKLLKENMSADPSIYANFQSPILGSPFIMGDKGGISLASFASRSPFAKELIKTIELMVPPEYRSIGPPKKAFSGSNFEIINGMNIRLAERPYKDKNYLSGLLAGKYEFIEKEQEKRRLFEGEFSIFSTLKIDEGHASRVWNELFLKFPKTEITLPYSLDEIIKADIVILNLKRNISEEVWANVVKARDFNPMISDEKLFKKFEDLLIKDIEIYLDEVFPTSKVKEMIMRGMTAESIENLRRIAQSFARSEGHEEVVEKDLMNARGIILTNLKGFLDNERFERQLKEMKRKKPSISKERFYIVQYELLDLPESTINEIFENVKQTKMFHDIYDLQVFLDWLHREGYVLVRNGKYKWI